MTAVEVAFLNVKFQLLTILYTVLSHLFSHRENFNEICKAHFENFFFLQRLNRRCLSITQEKKF